MNTTRPPDTTGASLRRPSVCPLLGALLCFLLGWGSAARAQAPPQPPHTIDGSNSSSTAPFVISTVWPGTVTVNSGGYLNVVDGAYLVPDLHDLGGIIVNGGTVNISGGSIMATDAGVTGGGTVSVSGGSISGGEAGVYVEGGTVDISGGSISGGSVLGSVFIESGAVDISGGSFSGSLFNAYFPDAVRIHGCGLRFIGSTLIGRLQYGTGDILWSTHNVGPDDLISSAGLPQVSCPPNVGFPQPVPADAGACSALLDTGTAVAQDNCHSSLPVVGVRSDGRALGAPYPIGTTTITWTATNENGSTPCLQTVTIADTQKPTISAPAPVPAAVDPGRCTASQVTLGTPVTWDNCGVASVTNDAPSTFPIGPTTVTWTVIDLNGNQATTTQTITVTDAEKPTIGALAPVTVAADPGQCAAGSVALGTPVTGDNCGVASVTNDAPVSFPGGSTVVTWTVTDVHGNQATATQTVTVTDTQKPTISPPPPFTVAVDSGQCTASHVGLGTPATQDNCGIATVTNDSPGSFPVGATTVTWTVTDVHGNQATATQTVTVTDQQPPTISCPGNQTVLASSASGTAVTFAANATDNCGVPSVVCTNQKGQVVTSGSIFPPGTTTVTCKAVDAAGNYSACSFAVTVTSPNADLSLAMNGSPNPVVAAGNTSLTYTLIVTNNGPQPAQGVVVTDPLPSGTAFASATTKVGSLTTPKTGGTGTVTWSTPTLGSGQSATLTVVVKVTAKAGATLNNVASVSASSPTDASTGNNTATVSTPVTKS